MNVIYYSKAPHTNSNGTGLWPEQKNKRQIIKGSKKPLANDYLDVMTMILN